MILNIVDSSSQRLSMLSQGLRALINISSFLVQKMEEMLLNQSDVSLFRHASLCIALCVARMFLER